MPTMERPVTNSERRFNQVALKRAPAPQSEEEQRKAVLKKIGNRDPNVDSVFNKKDKTKMDKDGFLKLLTHQLQNQDPLNPMENGQLGGGLAQYSQLEQLSNLNSKFDKFGGNAETESQFYGASFLGKEVVTQGNTLKIEDNGKGGDVLFSLPTDAQKVLVRIHDKNNAMVGEFWRENVSRGNQKLRWDGVQLDGSPSIKGDYKISVQAWDQNAEAINVQSKVVGVVDSVYFEDGETILQVDGRKVFLRDVDSFHMPKDKVKTQTAVNQANNRGVKNKASMNSLSSLPQQAPSNGKILRAEIPEGMSKASRAQKSSLNTANNKAKLKAYNAPSAGLSDIY